jgi:hypothetical protein
MFQNLILFPSSGEKVGYICSVKGPLERVNLNQWTTRAGITTAISGPVNRKITLTLFRIRGMHVAMILVGKPRGRGPLRIPTRRWGDRHKNDLQRYDEVVWIGLIWLRIETSGGLL